MRHLLLTAITGLPLMGYASIYPNTEKEIRCELKDANSLTQKYIRSGCRIES
jgi:hypothetical protein